jgi:hypothetical protein
VSLGAGAAQATAQLQVCNYSLLGGEGGTADLPAGRLPMRHNSQKNVAITPTTMQKTTRIITNSAILGMCHIENPPAMDNGLSAHGQHLVK